ncbi:hypothetical protein C457_13459 [Haloferax prahovense DSM 18310]|uniref:Uncharacterized protein n=2 Tax=Haloferax prahovense TaxID=381852 RepID=M0G6A3_HALPT|nr:hypothetical protein C457_13459 [Haloferax prahovense DSM 18310]
MDTTGYKLKRTTATNYDLENPSGTVIASSSGPVSTGDEWLLDAILDDVGVTNSQIRAAIKGLVGSVEMVDAR